MKEPITPDEELNSARERHFSNPTPPKRLEFTSLSFADVSTAHITAADGKLILNPKIACCLGVHHGGFGSFFWVPDESEHHVYACLSHDGFSNDFINLFKELSRAGFKYVRLDGEADEVEGLPKFDW